MFEDRVNDDGCFAGIAAVFENAVGYEMVLYPEGRIIVIRGREDDEVALVKLVI